MAGRCSAQLGVGIPPPHPPPCARSGWHVRRGKCAALSPLYAPHGNSFLVSLGRSGSQSGFPHPLLDFCPKCSCSQNAGFGACAGRVTRCPWEGWSQCWFPWPHSRPRESGGAWGGGEGLQIHLLLNVPWGFHCTLKFENTTLCRLLCFTETERKFPSL